MNDCFCGHIHGYHSNSGGACETVYDDGDYCSCMKYSEGPAGGVDVWTSTVAYDIDGSYFDASFIASSIGSYVSAQEEIADLKEELKNTNIVLKYLQKENRNLYKYITTLKSRIEDYDEDLEKEIMGLALGND